MSAEKPEQFCLYVPAPGMHHGFMRSGEIAVAWYENRDLGCNELCAQPLVKLEHLLPIMEAAHAVANGTAPMNDLKAALRKAGYLFEGDPA